ncbi:hypothetical protein PSTG_08049 [Puccinia striiformis f. sp. tritici PST-78]|uniref:Uncharacterized protein n=1 Tax=Puccinia striiformis f. sp. tritici PST-78 TaxID=1165861 RepID=A0A0L0VHC4_9BASI|nr:hypothetical protein PSTG_08049 [Puccinia striiformis f. sp. tritici PST-78]
MDGRRGVQWMLWGSEIHWMLSKSILWIIRTKDIHRMLWYVSIGCFHPSDAFARKHPMDIVFTKNLGPGQVFSWTCHLSFDHLKCIFSFTIWRVSSPLPRVVDQPSTPPLAPPQWQRAATVHGEGWMVGSTSGSGSGYELGFLIRLLQDHQLEDGGSEAASSISSWLSNSCVETLSHLPPRRKLGGVTIIHPAFAQSTEEGECDGAAGTYQPTAEELTCYMGVLLRKTRKHLLTKVVISGMLLPITLAIDVIAVPFSFEINNS